MLRVRIPISGEHPKPEAPTLSLQPGAMGLGLRVKEARV